MWGSIAVAIVYAVVPICCVLIGFGLIRRDYGTPESTETTSPQDRSSEEGEL